MRAPWDLIRRPVDFRSPLPPDEILGRLGSELAPVGRQILRAANPIPGERQAGGWVHGRHVWLVSGRRGVQNSWRPTLHVRIEPYGEGARLRGRIGWSLYVTAFMLVWCAFCGFGLAQGDWVLLGFLAFGVALAAVGTAMGRRDERALLEWLEGVAEAAPAAERAVAGLPG